MCRKYLCEESLAFLLAVLELHESEGSTSPPEPSALLANAGTIINKFVRPGSDYEVNISSTQVRRVLEAYSQLEEEMGVGSHTDGARRLSAVKAMLEGHRRTSISSHHRRASTTSSNPSTTQSSNLHPHNSFIPPLLFGVDFRSVSPVMVIEEESMVHMTSGHQVPPQKQDNPSSSKDNFKFSRIFKESYAEIDKMLSQNIMPKLRDTAPYRTAIAAYQMKQEQEQEADIA